MATTIRSTNLDFDTLKSRLKDYLKSRAEFSDYDFEGSGLSNVLDVLAYNTHFNGLIANFALNESFLNTAQLRSSVVSHAEALGYVPWSYVSSSALLNLSVTISDANRPTSITLPAGTRFTAPAGGVSYTFRTREAYTATDDGSGVYSFVTSTDSTDIPVYEGIQKTKTFFVGETDETQIYVIPDITADTDSLDVRVYDTAGSSTYVSYTDLRNAIRITTTSKHYQVKEVPNGYYELVFGDGQSTGLTPSAGNKIVVTYLSAAGEVANGAETFTPVSDLTVEGYGDYPISITTSSESAGGSFKESIESIRQNAPIQFASQQRLVVAEDYKAQILSKFGSYLTDVISWGGADNNPPEYGKVFVGLKFKDGISSGTQAQVKNDIITTLTDNLAIMSIVTDFTDPIEVYLEIETFFNFDPDLSNLTPRATENLVFSTIQTYFNNNLKKFGKIFRRSDLLGTIDDLDEAILNSRMNVKLQRRFNPVVGQALSYTITYPVTIANPDDVNRIVTSGRFTFNSRTCFIRNKLSSNKLEIVDIDGNIQVDNVGEYNASNGTILLQGFNPSAIEAGSTLKISVVPTNQSTVRPLRNYILDLDAEVSFAQSQLDYQETRVTL